MYVVISIFTIVLLSYVLYLNQKRKKNVNEFPSPPSHFLLGNIKAFRSTTEILKVCSELINKYGSIVKLKGGPYFTVLLTCDYNFILFILGKNRGLKKSENYSYLKPWLGSGLLINEGAEWKRSRKILTPAFHFTILKHFISAFETAGSTFVKKLEEFGDSKCIDIVPLITQCTLAIICETAMDTKVSVQKNEDSEYIKSVVRMTRIVIDRSLSLMGLKDWSYIFTSDYYLQKKLVKILHNFTSNVVASRKEKLKDANFEKSKKLAFLDLLLNYRDEEGRALSDQKIREEVDTFMFEGHDTTASAISFTLFCLANHPEVQNKVLKEQTKLFGENRDVSVSYQDLQNMRYLENVIKESLRLYPPVPIIGRYTTEELQFGDRVIDKKTNIVIFLYGLHRNPDLFPNPEKFDPDRFENIDGSLPYAYIPFSAGERNCIGQKFAILEIKSIISKIIRHFELKPAEPNHELVLSMEIVLKSASGIKIGLKKRV